MLIKLRRFCIITHSNGDVMGAVKTSLLSYSNLVLVSIYHHSRRVRGYIVGCRGVDSLGGLVPVVRLGVPLRCKACKLCDSLCYLLYGTVWLMVG